MMRRIRIPDSQARRLDEAAAWHLRLADEVQPGSDFVEWLADPLNRGAFDAVCAGWNAFADQSISPELIGLRRAALASAGRQGARRGRWAALHHRWVWQATAAVMAGLLFVGIWTVFFQGRQTYVTALGERRVLTLTDGTRVSLDSNTRLDVHYTKYARNLRLERGQARFDVAHDMRRSLTVKVGAETVVAVGTSFNVEQLGTKVLVTLIEGRVVVNDNDESLAPAARSSPSSLVMFSGQLLVAAKGRKSIIMPTNVANATAWQNGILIFNDIALEDEVERVNRYTDRPVVAEPAVSKIRVSGAFSAGEVNGFIEAVTMYFPIAATVGDNGRVVLKPRLN
jgi:transmembrane sensor